MPFVSGTTSSAGDPSDIPFVGLGLKAATWNPLINSGNSGTSTTDLRGTLCHLVSGQSFTKIWIVIAAGATVVTHYQAGICDTAGNVLCKTADSAADRTAIQSTGFVSATITQNGAGTALSAYVVPATGDYFVVGTWSGASGPNLYRGNVQGAVGPIGTNIAIVNASASGTLGTTININTALSVPPWFGLS